MITARRGDAVVDPETELSEDDIARYGANTIGELLGDVGPLIDGTSRTPVILVNGKRIGTASGITGFPPEALARLAILPPVAAARYGYPADQRVVNLVLKQKFSSWEGEAGLSLATAGGRDSETTSVSRVVIDGPTYWNAQFQLSRDSMLLKSARFLSSQSDSIDLHGHITGASGPEIDPALSQLVGREIAIVDIPPAALTRPPALNDFAAAAARPVRLASPDDYYALLPGNRSLTANLGVTHPLGSFSGSLNVNFNANRSILFLGYPDASLVLPTGSPWSPFANDVVIKPDFTGVDPLTSEQETRTLGVSGTVTGSIGGWNTNLIANYNISWSDNRFDRGLDLQEFQNRLDRSDPSFDPYSPLPKTALIDSDRLRSRTNVVDAKLIVDRTLFSLPSGPLTTGFTVGFSRVSVSNDNGASSSVQGIFAGLNRSQLDLQASLNVPLTRRKQGKFAALGDLSANVVVGISATAGEGTQRQLDASVNWSPASALQLYGGYSFADVVPSVDQLNGPRIETVVRIYDPIRQETAEPIWITGGNPDLRRGTKTGVTLKGTWRPFGGRLLTVNLGYQQQTARGGYGAFPQLTPAVERAFPDRITRDPLGRLIAIDARTIGINRDVSAQLTNGLTLVWPSRKSASEAGKKHPSTDGQISLTVNHTWGLKSELTVRPDIPALDRLEGDGGQSRHLLSLQVIAAKRGMGTNLLGRWQSAVRVRNTSIPDGRDDLLYSATMRFDFEVFIEPGNLCSGGCGKKNWATNTRISINVQNILDSSQRVTFVSGQLPPGYDRYDLNPLGRTIQVTLRKRF